MKRLNDNSDAPEARHGIVLKTLTSSEKNKALPAASTKELEEREFVVDCKTSLHMVSKRDLNSVELETMRTSMSPTTVMIANGEVQTREEATVSVKELDLFVTVMLLEETPPVLCLGKLCEDHGFSHHCISSHQPHLTKNGKRIYCSITMYHSLSLVYPRVLPRRPHLLLHHHHHRILYLTSTNTPKIQYPQKWKYE